MACLLCVQGNGYPLLLIFNLASHISSNISSDATVLLFSVSGSKSNFKRIFADSMERFPKDSYLITLNPNAPLIHTFSNNIVLPGYSLTNKSVIDTEAVFMCFVEILLNLLHDK